MNDSYLLAVAAVIAELDHADDTRRVLGRLFAQPIELAADDNVDVPWELANAVD